MKILKEINVVGQLGTEPNSFLFNFDDMFTFGYASSIDAPIQDHSLHKKDKSPT